MKIAILSLALMLPVSAYAFTPQEHRVLLMWIRQASDEDIATFVESSSSERAAKLESFAADMKVVLEQKLASYDEMMAKVKAAGEAQAAELADVAQVAAQ